MDNNFTLDYSDQEFEALLDQAKEIILDRYQNLDDKPAYGGNTPEVIKAWLNEPLPAKGQDKKELLNWVKEKVLDTATMNIGPNLYAYVLAGGTHMSIAAEMLATSINQNVGKWHLAPVISEMEKRVVQWGAEFMGYGSDVGGVLVSGGSAANLTGLTVARNVYFEKEDIRNKGLFGFKPFIVYASDEVHGCVDKSIELLGIGMNQYRKIPTDHNCIIDLKALKQQIEQDIADGYQPFCLIGNAGTVNTGAIDPLDTLADIAKDHNMWYHIDGAYGGLAGGLHGLSEKFKGIERADSVAVDFHKWLYQPLEAGCTLVKNWKKLNQTFYKKAAYLDTDTKDDGRFDFNEHHFQLSRNAKALKVWMSFKAYGADAFKQAIQKDIDLAKYLADEVEKHDAFELCNNPDLSVTCFRYLGTDTSLKTDKAYIDKLNKAIIPALEKDARVFITGTTLHQRPVIRACMINHRIQKSHMDRLLKVISEVGADLEKQMQPLTKDDNG
ncbi:aminotransferase class I/II-fold pyridoxal phosphate-dependent enzyme [Fulvivirga sp. RKSG066]|uniref:pyridoxal phosphate-dependent decarboxylase family protein n=1 Tax=Fulvivirga aurantia TaxID=2529383 RepID=UPI0012BBE578|nr:pyridoxal-dependent decarboxylase [Fulvivirga aurantia]MTI20936.1 aminotransferase class I/II-fold pyridoxal phosphate-dependent enzyme [Fulvivirga aurantia]